MCAELGNVDRNLAQAESLAGEALKRGARLVVLPEFFTTAMAFSPKLAGTWRDLEGEPLQLLKRLAHDNEGVVGGSFIARSGSDCFNSFILVFPDGTWFKHNKDLPTMWESCYYVGGTDDGFLETPCGAIGVALCWEMIRNQTARRLSNRIDLLLTGSCWWDFRLPVHPDHVADRDLLLDVLHQAPGRLARMLGVPVIHASHAGDFAGDTPGKQTPYRSRYLGETQIVDGRGEILESMSHEDGEGVILAEVRMGRVGGERDPIPEGFWNRDLPDVTLKAWENLNEFGSSYYLSKVRPLLAVE